MNKIVFENKLKDYRPRLLHLIALLCGVVVFRYLCHSVMLVPVLWNELRPAPHLPDLLMDLIPQNMTLLHYNYWLWLVCYVPLVVYFFTASRWVFLRFMVIDGCVSLARGLCIPLTGFGPPFGGNINLQDSFNIGDAWLELINPVSSLFGNSAQKYLTQDMFFSGHIATTFLVFLYARTLGKWTGRVALLLHLFTLTVVLMSHLHYTVDIVGAYAITFSIYTLLDWRLKTVRWMRMFD